MSMLIHGTGRLFSGAIPASDGILVFGFNLNTYPNPAAFGSNRAGELFRNGGSVAAGGNFDHFDSGQVGTISIATSSGEGTLPSYPAYNVQPSQLQWKSLFGSCALKTTLFLVKG